MSELQLQAKCYQWAHNTYPQLRKLLFAVPNGGTRNIREAMSLKASGVVSGVPDMICLYGGKPVGIELKTATGTVSTEQKQLHEIWLYHGIEVKVVRSFEEFELLIQKIIQ